MASQAIPIARPQGHSDPRRAAPPHSEGRLMYRTINMIHRNKAMLDLTNEAIAKRMSGDGVQVVGDTVQKIFAGHSGIPIDNLESFLRALGLKVVDESEVSMSADKHRALMLLAAEALNREMIDP
jgi:hypothetical protein